ncbi:MAG: hypothetical protein IJZ74_06330 [Clostridia bacterium]|nr:hypothetical protein [Clostridia bacterium]
MRDFIFLIGPSGVGKSTLARGLFGHYQGALAEMNLVPEFGVPEGVDPGLFEERVCWHCCVAQLKEFHAQGVRNVISGDFDDLRTADIPQVFYGYDYITLKLVCSNREEHRQRMLNRGEGLIDLELLEHTADKVSARQNLPNEFTIDTAGKTAQEVLQEAIRLIDTAQTLRTYDYTKPPRELFYSWVISNGLR